MEFKGYHGTIVNRIRNFEPDIGNAIKIADYLYFKYPDRAMSCAFGTNEQIVSLVNEAKAYFVSNQCFPSQTISGPFAPPSSFELSAPHYSGNCLYPDRSIAGLRPPPNLRESCHFFSSGYCKNGNDCKYIHGRTSPASLSYDPKEFIVDDRSFHPGSLELLEVEITKLLKESNGKPVSVTSLPLIYQQKYGRTLQAEEYLIQSQRHWKAGFTLTMLLARLNSIQLIQRPNGKLGIVLASRSSEHVFLSFRADCSFTYEDVSNYFKQFGPVREVRIPYQEKRTFGFVSFVNAVTVRTILDLDRPHYICGSRVLVKPYKEKTGTWDRNHIGSGEIPMYDRPRHFGIGPETQALTRGYMDSRSRGKQPMFEDELPHELERKRIPGQQPYPDPFTPQICFENVMGHSDTPAGHLRDDQESDDIQLPEDPFSF